MSMNQFIITTLLAMLLGGVLCLAGSFILTKLKKYYQQLTFKHQVLEPYTFKKTEKDKP